ncbi:fungal-specific transcription factor domain-containing protein [Phaeosphaeria sp. MPI-PUGE-AT-0046c]|nr:fungal-specific transcription factor domain-containing protein [Phaeosphaeria sp. MPI-PUGE-AT-0046c]
MKSYDGCWTCRLRKKRCDEFRPECRNCSTLQIVCYFDDEKPAWMDNAAGQKEKAEEVKREVKSAAARRRGVLSPDTLEPSIIEPDMDTSTSNTIPNPLASSTESTTGNGYVTLSDTADEGLVSSIFDVNRAEAELDRRFVMLYLDHFFPFLFPFYKPLLLDGGRTWILELAASDQAMWQITLCLSAYFVSVTLDGTVSGREVCKVAAWEKLLKQVEITFTVLHRNLQEVNPSGAHDMLVKTARIMGNIIQLQRFEIAVGNFDNWQKHLNAAISLFKNIFKNAEGLRDDGEPSDLDTILTLMGRPLWTTKAHVHGARNSDQAAFRFYSSLLMVDDIVAGICTGEAPQLREYHARLLTKDTFTDEKPSLSLEDFMGCENWVVLQMAEISALDAWKKQTRKTGRLDMMQVVARASTIQQKLLENLARLDNTTNTSQPSWLGVFGVYNDQLPPMPGGCVAFVTRVWAHAALLYLTVTVSGWQPGSAGIRGNVTRILALLERMPTPELLRTVVWPYCIVGCLCEPAEEAQLRAMADSLVPHRLYGPARKAFDIMENVWRRRNELDIDTDFATCVGSLGYTSLLV